MDPDNYMNFKFLLGDNCRLIENCKNSVYHIYFTPLPLIVIPYIIVLWYHNHKIDINSILLATLQNILFLPFSHIFICVCVVLYNFILCIESCNHHHNWNIYLFSNYQETPCCYPVMVNFMCQFGVVVCSYLVKHWSRCCCEGSF